MVSQLIPLRTSYYCPKIKIERNGGIKEKLVVALVEPTLDLRLLGFWCKIKGTELIARYFTCDFFHFYLLGCLSTTDVSLTSPTYPTSPTKFLPVTSSPNPLIQISQPVSQPKLMASFPGSSPTVQPSRPTNAQRSLRRSCSADVRMISPAHVQLVSAIPFPNLQPAQSTPRFQTPCLQVLNNETYWVCLYRPWNGLEAI